MKQSFSIPWPPSVNHMYINRRGSYKRIKTDIARSYYDAVFIAARGKNKHVGMVELWISLYPPDNRRRDIDNSNKAILDSLTKAGLWDDDSQIKRLHLRMMHPDKERPRVEILSEDFLDMGPRSW